MNFTFDFGKLAALFKSNRFNVISWGVTALLVVSLLGSTMWWTRSRWDSGIPRPEPTAGPNQNQPSLDLLALVSDPVFDPSIGRQLELKTNIPERPRFDPVTYRVSRGDSMFGIAKQFKIKPESILFSNKEVLNDNPENLTPGMELIIPPVDGLLYQWKPSDTLQQVADEFKAKPDDILNWPGNNIDLTNPQIKPGTVIMIPGGQRELVDWTQFIPTISRGTSGAGTGTSNIGTHACNGGPVGSGFIWPTNGPHTISGNDYGPAHLGIDITATEGTPVLAASAGVVVMAQGGFNYGYGNVVQIDHGNGYSTVYAHLSQINVSVCQAVSAGQLIGLAGSTGNSTGAHLHFEIRRGGANLNPWELVQ
jgi:murein DD-endopeptidase MepM/ murein hydrolase activator NlpD